MPLFNGGFSFPFLSLDTDRTCYENVHSILDSPLPLITKTKIDRQSSQRVILKLLSISKNSDIQKNYQH